MDLAARFAAAGADAHSAEQIKGLSRKVHLRQRGFWHLRIRSAAASSTAHQLASISLGLLGRRVAVALAGDLQGYCLLPLAGIGRQGLEIQIGEQGEVLLHHRIGHLLKLGIHRKRIFREPHRIAQAFAHLLHAIEARQDRQQHSELGALAEMALQVAAHGHIEFLIGTA